MDQILDFSNIALYTVLLFAIGLFLLFRFLSRLVPIIAIRKEKRKHAWRYISLIELAVWIVFLIWSVNYLSESSPIYAFGLFLMLFFFTFYTAWVALKDYIIGAFFKANTHLKINETLKIDKYSGKIIRFNPSGIVLETESGETIYLPYSTMMGKAVVKSNPAETILSHSFRMEIPKTGKLSTTIRNIQNDIIIMPWASLKKSPQIKSVAETITAHVLEITIFSIEKEYFLEMENLIKQKYAGIPGI